MEDVRFQSVYEQLGGAGTIERLVNAFYPKVYADPDLAPLFEGDIEEIKRKQKMFLTQFLGGPTLYSNEFGPPAMRYRHMPFEITPTRGQAWLRCMKAAFEEIELTGEIADAFYAKLQQVAAIMVNTEE